MWISERKWDQLANGLREAQSHLVAEHAKNVELERTNAFLQTSEEWMRGRINQLEYLSARLTEKEHGIPVGHPVIGKPFSLAEALGDGADLFTDQAQKEFEATGVVTE